MLNLFIEWQERLAVIGLMYARITPIFLLLPIFNTSAMGSMVIRNGVIFTIIIGLWPSLDITTAVIGLTPIELAGLALKEAVIGGALGMILALPFWIFSAFGAYIDVARGASLGSLLDPTSGQESTEVANFINFCVMVAYLELGGLRYFLEALGQSYQTIGLMQGFTIRFNELVLFLGQLVTQGFILASPVLLMLLLTESLLGVFSRFTPQLNAFSISLTIKSVIALFILMMYFWQITPEKILIFMGDYSNLHFLYGPSK